MRLALWSFVVLQLPFLQDLDESDQPGAICEICAEVAHLQPALLQVDIHPVLEGVGLYLYPLLLPAPDVHALGGVALGRPGGQSRPVSLGHPPVHRHGGDCVNCVSVCQCVPLVVTCLMSLTECC